jgi:hypothetical protein
MLGSSRRKEARHYARKEDAVMGKRRKAKRDGSNGKRIDRLNVTAAAMTLIASIIALIAALIEAIRDP